MKNLVVTLVVGLTMVATMSPGMACTADEATAKFNERVEQLSSGSVPSDKVAQAWTDMNEAGTALSNQDYDLACQIYDRIAEEYGLDK